MSDRRTNFRWLASQEDFCHRYLRCTERAAERLRQGLGKARNVLNRCWGFL
jgi:hypothetical protein